MFMINLRNGEIYVIKLKTFGSFTVGNDLTSVQEGATQEGPKRCFF